MNQSEFDDAKLATLSVADLEALQSEVTRLIAEKAEAEKAALRGRIEALASGGGFTLAELFEETPVRRRRGRSRDVSAESVQASLPPE